MGSRLQALAIVLSSIAWATLAYAMLPGQTIVTVPPYATGATACSATAVATDTYQNADVADISETLDIGEAADDRYIAIVATTSGTFSSATVGGVAITVHHTEAETNTWVGVTNSPVTSGTTATVVVDTSDNGAFHLSVWRLVCISDPDPDTSGGAIQADTTQATQAYELSVTLPTRGGGLAYVVCRSSTQRTYTWTGASEEFDSYLTNASISGASISESGTVTATADGNCGTDDAMLTVTWGGG